jgi:O-antigen ligase
MINRLRPYVAPAYLLLCLLIGGSAQGAWGNAILRLIALALIAVALIKPGKEPVPKRLRWLLGLAALAVFLVLLQLLPLPVAVWSALPGRDMVLSGVQLLGLQPGPMPLSLAPYDSLATSLALLPPLGMLAAMLAYRETSPAWLAGALIAGAIGGVLLGILQVSSPDPIDSPWYLYRQSNFGVATGFFANSNHMAGLLLVTIPFIAALGARVRERSEDVKKRSAALALVGGGLVVVILGLMLNGSLAGYGLGGPVVLASLLMLLKPPKQYAAYGAVAIGLISLAAVALLWASPVSGKLGGDATVSVSTRQSILANSAELAKTYMPFGSGIGTFQKVYPLTEDPAEVDRTYVNHAHNDYLELAIETGLPGIVLMIMFLAWWGVSVWRMLRSPAAGHFAVAAAIGSAAALLHSLVDYPLRTAAFSATFAMCLALIILSRRSAHSAKDLRPTRHVSVG